MPTCAAFTGRNVVACMSNVQGRSKDPVCASWRVHQLLFCLVMFSISGRDKNQGNYNGYSGATQRVYGHPPQLPCRVRFTREWLAALGRKDLATAHVLHPLEMLLSTRKQFAMFTKTAVGK